MRIVGGKYRSRVLAEFAGDEVRPTSDRAREALFNILYTHTIGARVLDLFAGSGALGIESLSRGAEEVWFNDLSKDSLAILRKNLSALNIGNEARVTQSDYAKCLETCVGKFDIIFIDPPYRFEYGKTALEIISKKGLLTENGIAVYERDKPFEGEIDGLEK
jgi:16S rRNA (guanine(966)-N(2))-methyltransferase RsmD